MNLPGFRPGKIPLGLVRRMAGVQVVAEEVSKIVNKEVSEYLNEHKISIIGSPLLKQVQDPDFYDIECEKELVFEFEIGLEPELEVNLAAVAVPPKYDINVDEPYLTGEVNKYRERFGGVTNPEQVQKDDLLYGRALEVDEAGEAIEHGFDRMFALNPSRTGNEAFFEPFYGKKVGDIFPLDIFSMAEDAETIASLVFIEAEEVEALRGKSLHFELKKINRMGRAELNEEFFDKVAKAYNWEATDEPLTEETFLAILSDKMRAELADSANLYYRNKLQTALLAAHPMELPEAFLKKWLASREDGNPEQIEASFDKHLKSASWTLILEKIGQGTEFQVSEHEIIDNIKSEVIQTLARSGMNLTEEQVKNYLEYALQNEEMVNKAYSTIRQDKVYTYLESQFTPENQHITASDFISMLEGERLLKDPASVGEE